MMCSSQNHFVSDDDRLLCKVRKVPPGLDFELLLSLVPMPVALCHLTRTFRCVHCSHHTSQSLQRKHVRRMIYTLPTHTIQRSTGTIQLSTIQVKCRPYLLLLLTSHLPSMLNNLANDLSIFDVTPHLLGHRVLHKIILGRDINVDT
jgi:hypothetical protein